MSTFRSEIDLQASSIRIDHRGRVFFHGSCFTDNIGQKLKDLHFPVIINPFGVVYNPLSALNSLGIILDNDEYTEDDIECFNELWFSWDHHSSFSNANKDECLKHINGEIKSASKHLKKTDVLLLTFGTAFVYRLKKNGRIVSNCHKLPEKEFDRIFLEPESIVRAWSSFIPELLKKNPAMKIIFTISPVRHWKDGAHGNQLSKASLLLATDQICKMFPDNTEYFPAYEILMDDLRDYRFYAEDMFHPNSIAVNYIWEKFEKAYFKKETIEINKELTAILQAKNHRVFNKETDAYRKFSEKLAERIKKFKKDYPYIDF
ncbi:MAG: GSCFA domain-containing protein [Bacteroidales bacterium]|nr:GSCFA domain-containing protein [Bacteroidales bacterium]